MKKYLFLTCCLLFLPFVTANAAAGDSCTVDLTANVPEGSWGKAFIIKASDNSAWQRAIISHPQQVQYLIEGDVVDFYGVAAENSQVQLFLSIPEKDAQGNLKNPGTGTCFETDLADRSGRFNFSMHSRVLWPNFGKEMMVDAYFRVHDSYDAYMELKGESTTNNDFFIGTNVLPTFFKVDSNDSESNCNILCEGSPLVRSVDLDPARIREDLLNNNLDGVDNNSLTMGRLPGPHTFYIHVDGDGEHSKEILRNIALKSLGMENLKRALLGKIENGGKEKGMGQISAQDLIDVESGKISVSKDTLKLVKYIKAALSGEADRAGLKNSGPVDRNDQAYIKADDPTNIAAKTIPTEQALDQSNQDTQAANSRKVYIAVRQPLPGERPTPQNPQPRNPGGSGGGGGRSGSSSNNNANGSQGGSSSQPDGVCPECGAPAPPPPPISREEGLNGLKEIMNPEKVPGLQDVVLPQVSSDTTWADDFILLLEFWTDSSVPNRCLMVQDKQREANFKNYDVTIDPEYQCKYVYVSGETPTILLETEAKAYLQPKFSGVTLQTSKTRFSNNEGWLLSAGKKQPISYTYLTKTPLKTKYIAESCITKADIPELVEEYALSYQLNPEEKAVLSQELTVALNQDEGYYQLSQANPSDIANYFQWQNENKPLQILQLFFKAEAGACNSRSIATPAVLLPLDRDGFEAGIL